MTDQDIPSSGKNQHTSQDVISESRSRREMLAEWKKNKITNASVVPCISTSIKSSNQITRQNERSSPSCSVSTKSTGYTSNKATNASVLPCFSTSIKALSQNTRQSQGSISSCSVSTTPTSCTSLSESSFDSMFRVSEEPSKSVCRINDASRKKTVKKAVKKVVNGVHPPSQKQKDRIRNAAEKKSKSDQEIPINTSLNHISIISGSSIDHLSKPSTKLPAKADRKPKEIIPLAVSVRDSNKNVPKNGKTKPFKKIIAVKSKGYLRPTTNEQKEILKENLKDTAEQDSKTDREETINASSSLAPLNSSLTHSKHHNIDDVTKPEVCVHSPLNSKKGFEFPKGLSSFFGSMFSFLFVQSDEQFMIKELSMKLEAEKKEKLELKNNVESYTSSLKQAKKDIGKLLDDVGIRKARVSEIEKLKHDLSNENCILLEKLKETQAIANRCYAIEYEMEKVQRECQDEVKNIQSKAMKEMEEIKFSVKVLKLKNVEKLEETSIVQLDTTNDNDPIVLRCKLQERVESLSQLEHKLVEQELIRKQMHNRIQELQGNIRVYVRVRPVIQEVDIDKNAGDSDQDFSNNKMMTLSPISIVPGGDSLSINTVNDKSAFNFNKVFETFSSQSQIFDEISDFIQSAMDGYNVCLFSYGQTGSGKTYTMQGYGKGDARGIIPRAVEQILHQGQSMQDKWNFSVKVSFLEIYNESLQDLLASINGNSHSPDQKNQPHDRTGTSKLVIRKDNGGRMFVEGLSSVLIDSKNKEQGMEELNQLMNVAARARSVSSTKMNAESSRSHSVFTLDITRTDVETLTEISGTLHLCDLAGSERLSRSESNADAKLLKETQAINKSLSCLGDVFHALASGANHVPYRNSKLTYLLQNCMGGDGKSCMLVNLSPTMNSCGESLCSLRFAQRVSQIELGKAKKNVQLSNKA